MTTQSVHLYGAENSPFNELGSTGYIGLGVRDDNEDVRLGWAEITRGSTIIGRVGYQTTPGRGALINVPEPSALAWLSVCVVSVVTRRRR